MIAVILVLVVIGVILHFVKTLPIDPAILLLIQVLIVLFVVYYLLGLTGLLDVPVPRFRW